MDMQWGKNKKIGNAKKEDECISNEERQRREEMEMQGKGNN
jgi:hypothetical protein